MNLLKSKPLVPKASMPILVDRMIRRITREGHLSGFTDEQLLSVLRDAKTSLEPQPATLEIDAPVVVFGDIHGQLRDLLRFLTIVGPPPQNKILFLGDYVDRCKKSLEVIMLLLCYRIKYPQLIHLLRGNHECSKMNRLYGFYEEMRRKRTVYMWKKFQEVFNEMPLCAVISSRLLCMHGGISPEIANWDSLVILQKPKTPRACDEGLAVDLMWSDPSSDPCTGFQFNTTRATSYIFGGDTILKLCELLDIALVVRAHEVVKGGHQFLFDKKLVTIFSAPNYCGTDGNAASVMKVSRRLELSFVTLKPRLDTTRLTEERRALLEKMMNDANAKSPDPCARQSKNNTQSSDSNTDTSCLVGPGVEIPTVPEATQPSPPPPPPKPAAPPPPPPPKPAAPPPPPPKPAAPPPKSAAPPPSPKPVAPPPPPKQPTPTPPESSILDADDQRKSDLLALVGVPVPTPKRASPTPTRMATSKTIISPKPATGALVPFQRRRDPTPAPTMATQQSSTVKLPPRQPSPAPAAKPNELDSTPRSSSLMSTTRTAQGSPSTARSLRSSPKPIFAPKTSAPKAASPPQRPHAGKGLSVLKKSPYELSELSDSDLSISEKKVSAPQKQQQPKPRSVEEAAKQAMTASKAPPQPNSRNQSEIIDATQKALTKPNREQQQK